MPSMLVTLKQKQHKTGLHFTPMSVSKRMDKYIVDTHIMKLGESGAIYFLYVYVSMCICIPFCTYDIKL